MSKVVLILGAGREQVLAIKKAKSLGYRTIACDIAEDAPGLDHADVSYIVDIRDVDAICEIGRAHRVNGVFSHAVEIPEIVAVVSKRLGLPGLDYEVADLCTNKSRRIAKLRESGLNVADYWYIDKRGELKDLAKTLIYPVVIKPVDSAGARGVVLVESRDEIEFAYEKAAEASRSNRVLIESFLEGDQLSTESVVYNGKIKTFAIADRNYTRNATFKPYFIEDGINFPSCLPDETIARVLEVVEKTIKALGINYGAAKGDILIKEGTIYVIEMACRTSGGWFGAGSIPIATGVDALTPLLQMSVSDEPDMSLLEPTMMSGCAQRYWIPEKDLRLQAISGLDCVPSMPGVKMFEVFFPAIGSRITKAQSHSDRYAHVICVGCDRSEAVFNAENAISQIRTVEG